MGRTIKDTIITFWNDEHSGSHVAPLPNKQWQLRGKNTTPTSLQKILWEHYRETAREFGKLRKGKRLVVVKLGDAIDGNHHETKELTTQYIREQKQINAEMTDYALKAMRFGKGDLMYWVAGTNVHVGEA